MKRIGTWLVVAAIGALGVAAAVDAFRGASGEAEGASETKRETATTTAATPDSPADRLRELGVRGDLLWIDADCGLHRVALPSFAEVSSEPGDGCRFRTAPGGRVAVGDAVPATDGGGGAVCDAGQVVRLGADGRIGATGRGCAPAWTPDGRLTAIRAGEVVELRPCGRDSLCPRRLVTRADLGRMFGGIPWAFADPAATEVAWLTDRTAAVLVHDRASRNDVIGIVRGRRLIASPPFPYEVLDDLRTSPRGTFAAARINRQALVVLDRAGRPQMNGLRSARAVAWTRDERWTAAATGNEVFVYETRRRPLTLVSLPFPAVDVAWE